MATVSGSIFRRTLFWAHLSCGVAAGVLILVMSATGVLLAYERQIVESSAAANRLNLPDDVVHLSADRLIEKARAVGPQDAPLNLIFDVDSVYPVIAAFGRQQLLLHPQTGEVLPDAAAGVRGFFNTIESWHRRLGGESNSTRATLLDIANLLFVFIVLSGIYLWLPAMWQWPILRARMFLRMSYNNSKMRDFSWHHIFSFWMLIPLFLIALSGVVISYPWANKLLFAAYGETPPQRQGQGQGPQGGAGPGMNMRNNAGTPDSDVPAQRASAQQLLDVARSQFVDWRRITLPANMRGDNIELTAELRSDAPRPPRQTLTLSTQDASVIRLSPPPSATISTQSPGQRARGWLRFIHTGEEYGLIGQTLAALASLAACFLVYTGLALAWRRLIVPLYRHR